MRIGAAAGIPAGATVLRVVFQTRADPVALDGALDAGVVAVPVSAHAVLVRTRLLAHVAAGAAVVPVIAEVGAIKATVRLTRAAAGEGAAVARQSARIRVARMADCEAVVPQPTLTTSIAELLARVRPAGPDGSDGQRAQQRSGE